ncbi:MAG: 2-oxoglutarate ferredoxin oxidoreductase subunit beta [Planctomycetota bacterium]
MAPEKTLFVSGIGCSARFPHYLKTYGFHGIHGRALPLALGAKLRRPDLTVFVVMGDGDCTSIGAGHWIHGIRYNTNVTVLLLDNNIYGLTKKQTSPTTPVKYVTNTQPQGSYLNPLHPIAVTLGVANASFVAQTADWIPAHLLATMKAAQQHKGLSFIRILQRCPKWTIDIMDAKVKTPDEMMILNHEDGITDAKVQKMYKNQMEHDPSDLDAARELTGMTSHIPLGLFYKNADIPTYDDLRRGKDFTTEEKMANIEKEFDRFAV